MAHAEKKPPPPVVIVQPPPPEPAPPEPDPAAVRMVNQIKEPKRQGLELWLGAAIFPAALGNVRFTGSGYESAGGRRVTFSHTGREIGLRNPIFWGPEFRLGYQSPNFAVAMSAAFGGNLGSDGTPTNAQASSLVGVSGVKAYGGAIEVFGSVPFGRLTLSGGAVAGLRGYSIPLVGFSAATCTSRTRRGSYSYPCAEDATTQATLYLQPRLRVDVALDKDDIVFLGAYIGMDALGDRSALGGAMFGVRFLSL